MLAGLGLTLVVLLAYANSFGAGFTLDNQGLILNDPRIHTASSENLARIFQHTYWWPTGESGLYRPVTTLSYLFNYAVLGNGGDPAGYHWINFLLHAGNVLLLWILARRYWDAFLPPLFLAVLWAVHPILTESVTNIVGRADLLAGAALLGGFLLYLKSAETQGWRRTACLAGLMAVTTVGVFSKESAVAILGVILLSAMDGRSLPSATRSRLWTLVRGCAAVLPPILWMLYQRSVVLAASAPTQFPFTDNPLVGGGFWTARLTALQVIARYLALLVWPVRLSCDYSFAQIPLATGSAQDWLSWIAVALAAAGVLVLFRWNRTGFFLAASAFLVFLPTSNLLFPFGTIMAERFLYLPSIAFAAGVVAAAFRFPRFAPPLLCVLIAAFAVRTVARNADWHDDLTISEAAVRASPRSFKTHMLRANALLESDPSHANIDQVIAEAEQSLAILDPLPDSRNNSDMYQRAGGYYFMKGDLLRRRNPDGSWLTPPESARAYQRAIELFLRFQAIAKSPDAGVEQQLAKLYLRLNQPERALASAVKARALAPDSPESHRIVAGLLVDSNREHEAVIALLEGVLVTGDTGLRQTLLNLYRGGLDLKGCATAPDGSLNPSCEAIHADLCAASAGAIRLRLETRRPDLARAMNATATRDFGCASGPTAQ